jgi:hypothetical protein
LSELTALISQCDHRVAVQIVFTKPPGIDGNWERTGLFKAAEQIPGAAISCDDGGIEAGRFGVTTSGEALLFAPNGKLLFQGGLTRARGHEGESLARTALVSLINSGHADRCRSPVFGCALLNSSPRSPEVASRCTP